VVIRVKPVSLARSLPAAGMNEPERRLQLTELA
jgi:hypothetical protein